MIVALVFCASLVVTLDDLPGDAENAVARAESTGILFGKILDQEYHRPVTGGTVRLRNTALAATPDDSGWYRLRGVPAGETIFLEYQGPWCTPLAQAVPPLDGAEERRVDLLVPCRSWTLDEILVHPKEWILREDHAGASTVLTADRIARLPTLGGSISDLTALTPFLNAGSAIGRNERYNAVQLDGVGFDDLFGLGRTGLPGGQANAVPFSVEAIERLEVQASPFDVRQSGFTGASIAAFTPQPGEGFSGKAYLYGRNEVFSGRNPDGGDDRLPEFVDFHGGVSAGGALSPSVSFFLNGELSRRRTPVTRTFGAPSAGGSWFTLPAESVYAFREILSDRYGYPTGSFEEFSLRRESEKVTATIRAALGTRHTLTGGYNFLHAFEENPPAYGGLYAENSRFTTRSRLDVLRLSLRSVLSPSTVNSFRFSWFLLRDPSEPVGPPFPFAYVSTRDPEGRLFQLAAGSENFRIATGTGQRVLELGDELLLSIGEHSLTVGGFWKGSTFDTGFIPDNYGTYFFNSLTDFRDGRSAAFYRSYAIGPDPRARVRWRGNQFALYLQDDWRVNDRLSVGLGLRVDLTTFPDRPYYNPTVDSVFRATDTPVSTDRLPEAVPLFSPRAAFKWSLDTDGATFLRGGIGAFLGRIPYVWLGAQYLGTGVDLARSTGYGVPFVSDPFTQPNAGPGIFPEASSEITLTSEDFRMPSVLRVDLALVRELPFGCIGTVEVVVDRVMQEVGYEDLNLQPGPATDPLTPGGELAGDGRPVFGTYANGSWTPSTLSPLFTHVMRMKNVQEGGGAALTLQLEGPRSEEIPNLSIAYTYSRTRDLSSNTLFGAVEQWQRTPISGDPNAPPPALSQFDRTHRVLVILTHRFAASGTTLGISYSGMSGRPFSYVVDGDLNGDGGRENDLLYVPRERTEMLLVDAASGETLPFADPAYDDLESNIDADPYLNGRRGGFAERNGAREPWRNDLNLRISQDIISVGGRRLEIVFDLFNVLNFLDRDWGHVEMVPDQRDLFATFHSLEIDPASPYYGHPRYIWGKSKPAPWVADNLASRWQAQLGLRGTF